MSLENVNIVDFISINEETGDITLTIADELDWEDEKGHLLLLQEKLNTYLRFIESGEVYQTYPAAEGRKIAIKIYAKYDFTNIVYEFLNKASEVINEAGFNLIWKVME